MDHRQHEFFGFILWILCTAYLILNFSLSLKIIYAAAISFFLCMAGSVIPDVDCKKSRAFYTLQLAVFIFFLAISLMAVPKLFSASFIQLTAICMVIPLASVLALRIAMPKHRGKIHSIKAGLVYAAASLALAYLLLNDLVMSVALAFFALMSFLSHLSLDLIIK
jgi:hypothetical protein